MNAEAILAKAHAPPHPHPAAIKRDKSDDSVAAMQPKKTKTIATKVKLEQRQSSSASTLPKHSNTTSSADLLKDLNLNDAQLRSGCAAYTKTKGAWPTHKPSEHAASSNKGFFAGGGSKTPKDKSSDTKAKDSGDVNTSGQDKGETSSSEDSSGSSSSDSSSSDSSSSSSSSDGDSEAGVDDKLTAEEKELISIRRRKTIKKVTKMLTATWPPNWDDIEAACHLLEVKWVCEDLNSISDKAKVQQSRFSEAAPHPAWVFESMNRMQFIVKRYEDCHTCTANPQHKAKFMAEKMIESMRELIVWDHCGGTFAGGEKKGGGAGKGAGKSGRK